MTEPRRAIRSHSQTGIFKGGTKVKIMVIRALPVLRELCAKKGFRLKAEAKIEAQKNPRALRKL
jgi:hypothetical protein